MICTRCLQDKTLDSFSLRDKKKNLIHKICKSCHSLYRKRHYLQNKDKYIKKALRWNKKQGEVLAEFLFTVLTTSKCIDCGEKDILVLEFDHLHGKKLGIANMYKNRYSIQAIKKELKKCVVRCANCHRRKTAKDLNLWKYKI